MKQLFNIFLSTFLLIITSCNTQRLVVKVTGSKKLETNKDNFIGKPLKNLLSEIKLKIKYVYGNPENNSGHVIDGTSLTFSFFTKDVGKKRISENKIPKRIIVNFQLEPSNSRKSLPPDGLTKWTEKETAEYGDMIIQNIRVIE